MFLKMRLAMKTNIGFAVLLVSFVCLGGTKPQSCAISASSDVTITPMRDSKPLKLTVKVVDQKYCTGDADLDGLRINVRLVYINTSNRPLILYKGSNLISRIMISNSLAKIEAGRYEVDSSVTQLTAGGGQCFNGTVPPSRCFVILPPASSYEVQGTIGILVIRDYGRKIAGAVGSGEHVVQVQVSTWPNSEALAEKLHRRWERSGCLWYGPITSEPLTFTVQKQREVVDCL
jgi:hypothetical protein